MQKYGICFFQERRPGRQRYGACVTRPIMTSSAKQRVDGHGVKFQIDSAVDPCENMDDAIKRFFVLLRDGKLVCKYGTLVLGKSGYFYFSGKGTGFKGRKTPVFSSPRNVPERAKKDDIPDLFSFADKKEEEERKHASADVLAEKAEKARREAEEMAIDAAIFEKDPDQVLAELRANDPKVWVGYDLADPSVRAALWERGAYRLECSSDERRITNMRCIHPSARECVWLVDGMTADEFCKNCTWVSDGTPCGVLH